jgi:hypothetical protein
MLILTQLCVLGRVFDELPPCFQTFVQVITVATIRCLYKVPLKAVAMAMG